LTVTNATAKLNGILGGVEGNGQTAYSPINLNGQTLAQLASTINVTDASYGITAQLNQAGTSLTFSATTGDTGAPTIGNQGNLTEITPAGTTSISLTNQPSASQSYYSVGISGNVTDTSTSATVGNKTTYGGTGNVGISANSNGSTGTATISYTDAAGVSLATTDLSNQKDAQATLTALSAAITDVAAQDGYIGAQINTLNAVSSVLSTQQENVTAAQNAVQATDYASATSNMSKYEILSQTGISALAQANSMQQEVTKLLQ
jgi:flagellin